MTIALAALATWALIALWSWLLGAWTGPLVRARLGWMGSLRFSIWIGFATLNLALLATNFFLPMVSLGAVVTLAGVTISMTLIALAIRYRHPTAGRTASTWSVPTAWASVPIVAFTLGLFVLADKTTGPVSNGDTGLYQLGAIEYAAEHRAIPGLANVHERFGFDSSSYVMSAFTGNSFWGGEAFRLLVGVYAFLLLADVSLRLLDRSGRTATPGLFILVLAVGAIWPFLLRQPDWWMTSPSPDSVSLLISVVAGAYLADAVWSRQGEWIVSAIVVGALAATVRRQLWVFLMAAVVVIVVDRLSRRQRLWPKRTPARAVAAAGGVLSLALLLVTLARDLVLSGWLLFPATVLPMPVAWRVPEPVARTTRDWIASWARDTSAAPDVVLASWSWLRPWLGRILQDWAIVYSTGLLAFAVVLLLGLRTWSKRTRNESRTTAEPPAMRTLLLCMTPVAAILAVWFVGAPDARFVWGPILLAGLIPAALAIETAVARFGPRARATRIAPLSVAAAGTALVAMPVLIGLYYLIADPPSDTATPVALHIGPLHLETAFEPLPEVLVKATRLDSSLELFVPIGGDQCWSVFPLCTPNPQPSLRLLGEHLEDGLVAR